MNITFIIGYEIHTHITIRMGMLCDYQLAINKIRAIRVIRG